MISRFTNKEMISIHALREEGDAATAGRPFCGRIFLSTPSARRATRPLPAACSSRSDFYPRPPRGGRQHNDEMAFLRQIFLSTPSARRATPEQGLLVAWIQHFYPRPPRGGRREGSGCERHERAISIHALREEGDSVVFCLRIFFVYFYPRPPRGGRRLYFMTGFTGAIFLSTPSARRATFNATIIKPQYAISIHALREEGDSP